MSTHDLAELVSLGSLPAGFLEELGHVKSNLRVIELDEQVQDLSPSLALERLEKFAKGLRSSKVLVLCPSGSGFKTILDEIVALLARPERELHLIVALPFGFEAEHGLFDFGVLRRAVFQAQSMITLDGRSLAARLPIGATLADVFRVHGVKLAHLVQDLMLVLSAPRECHVHFALTGAFRWEGTWASTSPALEHLVTLVRVFEDPGIEILASHGFDDPESLRRLPRRLRSRPFQIFCERTSEHRRLGGFFPMFVEDLL